MSTWHKHEGDRSPCGLPEGYDGLTYEEALDLVITLIDEQRPGTTKFGWEQLRLC